MSFTIYNRIEAFFHQIMTSLQVTLVEWLTRGPAIKLGRAFGRVGSNPAGDEVPCFFFFFFFQIHY